MTTPPLRSTADRIAAVLERLGSERDAWVASADATGEAYLIPLSFHWDGAALTFATPPASRTARNLRRGRATRVSLGSTDDVVVLDGLVEELALDADPALTAAFVASAGFDPRAGTAAYVLLRFTPGRIQTWRTEPELSGREVMRGGGWLAETPVESECGGPHVNLTEPNTADTTIPLAPPTVGLFEVVLEVADLAVSERFYREHLGLAVVERWEGERPAVWLALGREGFLGLWPPETGGAVAIHGGRGGAHVHLALRVPTGTLPVMQARLEALGYPVEGGWTFGPGDHAIYLDDPDGNVVELTERATVWGGAAAE